jgi:hypothetical protein
MRCSYIVDLSTRVYAAFVGEIGSRNIYGIKRKYWALNIEHGSTISVSVQCTVR